MPPKPKLSRDCAKEVQRAVAFSLMEEVYNRFCEILAHKERHFTKTKTKISFCNEPGITKTTRVFVTPGSLQKRHFHFCEILARKERHFTKTKTKISFCFRFCRTIRNGLKVLELAPRL
jgi:hypothetical protein